MTLEFRGEGQFLRFKDSNVSNDKGFPNTNAVWCSKASEENATTCKVNRFDQLQYFQRAMTKIKAFHVHKQPQLQQSRTEDTQHSLQASIFLLEPGCRRQSRWHWISQSGVRSHRLQWRENHFPCMYIAFDAKHGNIWKVAGKRFLESSTNIWKVAGKHFLESSTNIWKVAGKTFPGEFY